MFKVKNKDTRTTPVTPENTRKPRFSGVLRGYRSRSGAFIANFEHIYTLF